jgi:prepilin-type N-terminal cleavage/methylation domain-containing protein
MSVRGFTMIELLVALLVFALAVTTVLALALRGLAGIAEARRGDVASGLAADLAGRVRALAAVDWTALPAVAACAPACAPEQLAAQEFAEWQASVAAALPAGTAALEAGAGGDWALTLAWDETGGTRRELRVGIAR